uniref:Coat protein n=1 Tax=Riboviria sp. TaxID=2585031 RepID=A0A6M9Z7K5_9VIRU|nr:MAG: coat protein [Riboviria sp.]QKN89020.1 MAG: putative capsid protein [Riboviria sp.]
MTLKGMKNDVKIVVEKPKPQRQRRRPKGQKDAPVAKASPRLPGSQTQTISVSGRDQVHIIPNVQDRTGVLAQIVLTPESLPRLEKLGDAYQRIRYNKLTYVVEPLLSTSVSGGYTAGFVKDAADPIDEHNAPSTLLASGGVSKKMWESATVNIGRLPDLYYTNPGTGTPEYRWASPGSFVIYVDAPASSAGAIKVYLSWSVTLSEPTVQDTSSALPGVVEVLQDAYSLNNNYGLYDDKGKGLSCEQVFGVKLQAGTLINLPNPRYYSQWVSDTQAGYLCGYSRLAVKDDRPWPALANGEIIDDKALGKTLMLEVGERFVVTIPGSSGFLGQRPPWFHSPPRHLRLSCASLASFRPMSHLPQSYKLLTPSSQISKSSLRSSLLNLISSSKGQLSPLLVNLTESLRNLLEKLASGSVEGEIPDTEMWELVHEAELVLHR